MPDGDMTTAQLLAWAGHCLDLAREQSDGEVYRHSDEARQEVAKALRLSEETNE